MHTTIISAATLQAHLADPAWVVLDVRHELSDPQAGRAAYSAGHLPGAFFLHLDEDLSGPKNGSNGRHPLPDRASFAARLAGLGVNQASQVVIYDAQGSMMAARLWWMLRWIGHQAAAVLDGGMPAWLAAGGEIKSALPPARNAGDLIAGESLVGSIDAAGVMSNLAAQDKLVIDARAPDRFRGENETLDAVGGHIPGACNRFFRDNLQADGRFKPAAELRADFTALLGARPASRIIAQCGSGVTACHNLLALEISGLPGAILYPGSWSEWSSDPARPVATGN
ncbi:sulfurtransferase [Uliginosibacterium sp. 31-12]|uniref:sulfurtransferase n=1 Tax=Uliginosibacterium sp. 31-12 TaxID=3062781 RepID=UPI0026E3F6BD|nr:sulfurtransferase [Uliginosibacterium sp. 31-12]MDO6385914.1 sulfurtransferase [Uliginosibacterium sp. 31-12]